ncbi:MAG: trypsin-like peptidase domain-containing protein [Minicystis sp.]
MIPLVALLGACRAPTCPAARTPPSDARFPTAFGAGFGAGLGAPPSAAEPLRCEGALDLAALVERTRTSIVSVVAGRAAGEGRPFTEHGGTAREHALGSGILLTPDGLVLTSRHVIAGADDVRVELHDGRTYPGSVIARDAWLDVALIRLRGARGLPVATLGSSEAAKIGDPVVVIGNPFGLGPSVTRGILSAKGQSIDDGPSEVFLQTDAAVNPGDSGGPLLDAQGRVIGITTAVLEHGQGVSFAVPIDDVRGVIAEMLTTGRVARGHAGISYQPLDAPVARALKLPNLSGAIITELDARGPASRAGVREGDVVVAVDGRVILRASDLAHELGRRRPGETLRFGLMRDGRAQTIGVLLDRLPNREDEARVSAPTRERKAARSVGLKAGDAEGGGARVEAVDPDTTAADDLRPGDIVVEINRRAVKTAAELTQHLAAAPRPSTALLRVRRDGSFLYIGIDLE